MVRISLSVVIVNLLLSHAITVNAAVNSPIKTSSKALPNIKANECFKETRLYEFDYANTALTSTSLFGEGVISNRSAQQDSLSTTKLSLKGQYKVRCVEYNNTPMLYVEFGKLDFSQKGLMLSHIARPTKDGVYFKESLSDGNHKLVLISDTPPIYRNLYRAILGLAYFKDANQDNWSIQSHDIHGEYSANIQLKEKRHVKVYQEIDRIYKTNQADYKPAVTLENGSLLRYIVDGNVVKGIDVNLPLTFHLKGKLSGKSNTTFTLKYIDSFSTKTPSDQRLIAQYENSLKHKKWLDDLAGNSYEEYLDLKMQQDELGNMTWKEVETLLMTASRDQFTKAFLKMKAHLIVHPESAYKAADLLVNLNHDDSRFGLLSLALAESGTVESQQAMVSSIDRFQEVKEKVSLMRQMGLAKNPRPLLDQAIKQTANSSDPELAQTSKLALGNIGHNIQASAPQRYEALLKDAEMRLEQSNDYASTVNALHEIGNYGTDESIGIAQKYQTNKEPGIRATALETLRFVEGDKAENIILNSLKTDQHERVKTTAAQELYYRDLSDQSISEVNGYLKTQKSERMKALLLSTLGKHLDKRPDLVDTIKEYQNNDPSKEIRLHAKSILMRSQIK